MSYVTDLPVFKDVHQIIYTPPRTGQCSVGINNRTGYTDVEHILSRLGRVWKWTGPIDNNALIVSFPQVSHARRLELTHSETIFYLFYFILYIIIKTTPPRLCHLFKSYKISLKQGSLLAVLTPSNIHYAVTPIWLQVIVMPTVFQTLDTDTTPGPKSAK